MTVTGTASTLFEAIDAKPRVKLGHLPTPLDEAPRLSRTLGCRVLIKRDDQTGLALGGNKVRKLEFLVGDALAKGATAIVTTGGSQSNHARLTAAACRHVNLDCYLVLDKGAHPEVQGNMLLDHMFGARIRLIKSADPADAMHEMREWSHDIARDGAKPYVIPRGGSVPVGATGYALFALELQEQLRSLDIQDATLYLGTGSTGTHSGVLAGVCANNSSLRVEGISVSKPAVVQIGKVLELAQATLDHLSQTTRIAEDTVRVDDRFRGPGYGIPTEQTMEAIIIAARDEALLLDPVYTGKAMCGMIAHAREKRFKRSDTVVFLHTGGAPALFAYNAEMTAALQAAG